MPTATISQIKVFANGTDVGGTSPDSLTFGDSSLWVEYGNGADSTGLGGSSTILQYSLAGAVEHTYTVAGSVDGLKFDPVNGLIYALQNQDGNSTLSLIDPKTGTVSAPLSYAVASATRGYDDIAFLNGQVYESYTNPVGAGDPVVQILDNGNTPFGSLTASTTVLADGATGYDISTGQANQPIPLADPDSLKATPSGGLILTSGADNAFTLISDPNTKAQSERFVQLTNLPAGSSLDDVIIPTSPNGTLYVANAGTDQVIAIKLTGLNTSDAYASVGTAIVQVDLQTGSQTTILSGLTGSHGLYFAPAASPGPVVQSTNIFALGSEAGGATGSDSITMGGNSIWVEYENNSDSTGKLPVQTDSTIVQYSLQGKIEHTYSLPGTIDGLKYDPTTGDIWALKNQDANSLLYLIDPKTNSVSGPLSYASPPYVYGANSAHGYDDVAFHGNKVFLSATNPTALGDPVLVELDNGNHPTGTLTTTTLLRLGDTGTNLLTGQQNQPLPVADPDSLKTLPDGSLILTSDHDGSLDFIANPGTAKQTVSFITLPNGSSGLDDAVMPTSTSGTFYVSNGAANDVLKVAVTHLNTKDIYVSVGSDNAVDQLDLKTGVLTPIITGLNSPHGLLFVASPPNGNVAETASLNDVLKTSMSASDLLPLSTTVGSSSGSASGTLLEHASGFASPMMTHAAFTSTDIALAHHA